MNLEGRALTVKHKLMGSFGDKVDAIVVGAGAGGGVVAKQLAATGMKTVVFELGEWPNYDANSPNDELCNMRHQIVGSPHSYNGKPAHIANCVGSGTVTYGAMAWRFMPQDFKLKSIYGKFYEGSSLEDWPITYEELEPYYEQAEYEVGVSGDQRENPFAPPRKKPFPMPPFEHPSDDILIRDAAKRLGYHPYPTPMLRNSVPYNGRCACIRNRTCCGYVCPVDAKNGTHNTVIPVALKTGNCKLLTGHFVYEIIMEGKRAVGVRYFDKDKVARQMRADVVVLSAAAYQTARLLYNSKCSQFPAGIGNQNDQLGRHSQTHFYTGSYGMFDRDVLAYEGPGTTLAISDFNHLPREGIIGGVVCTEFYIMPWACSRRRPPNSPRWGAEHKRFQREDYKKIKELLACVQQVPRAESRVVLSNAKDEYGVPKVHGTGSNHPKTWDNAKFVSDRMAEILKEAGAKFTWQPILDSARSGGGGGGQHQSGTCRMGKDPKKSVVDPDCKVWGTENLYVADGSVHVNNGGFNPVLTIMALAFRTGKHIAEKYSKA